ncbi:DUF1552 domain-containing protein [Verrucomicrobiaceae bacterium 227]
MHIARDPLPRRSFLRAAGATLALPFLDAMVPIWARGSESTTEIPRRFIGICNNLGVRPESFFPTGTGRDYALSPYLEELAAYREQFTVLSGVSHPGVDGSHSSDVSFLTAAPHPGGGGFRNSISLDQRIAMALGHHTRFPSLTLGVNAREGQRSLSWTDSGVLIPCENSAAEVYRKLFLQGSPAEIEEQMRRLTLGESIMDTLADQSRALNRKLGQEDRERVDQYTTAVREVEQRMIKARNWERHPKPKPGRPQPNDPGERSAYMEKTRLMYEMAHLAIATDSTRSVTLLLDSLNSPTIQVAGTEISNDYHNLSHHGKSEAKLAQLDAIDRSHMKLLGKLISDLKSSAEGESNLLDRTTVVYGSNFGDANKHTTDNLPVLVAGGGFKHGQHLAFDTTHNYPLPNLFVSIMQRMGIESDQFASSTGTFKGLEIT